MIKNKKKKVNENQDITSWMDLREHAIDFIDTFESEEIAQMVREGILTIEEVEDGLRRKIYA